MAGWLLLGVVCVWPTGLAAQQPDDDGAASAQRPEDAAASGVDAAVDSADEAAKQAGSASAERTQSEVLSLFVTGNQHGYFIDTNCRDESPGTPHFALQHGYYEQMAREASAADRTAPVALNLGDTTFPGPLSRFLLTTSANGYTLAEVIGQIPWAAQTLGNRELALAEHELERFVDEARRADLPLQAANLNCADSRQDTALCDMLGGSVGAEPWRIVDRGRFSIGVTSILHPDAASAIAPDRMDGLELRDPEGVLEELVPRMRESGADITVVLLHGSRERANAEARELATAVRGIDVLVTSEVLSESETRPRPEESFPGGYLVAPETHTYIVEGNSGHKRVIAADLQLERQPDGPWRVRGIDTRNISPAEMSAQPDTAERLGQLTGRFCSAWGQPIHPNARLETPWKLEDFTTFLLNVMRFTSRSEIALYNDGALRNRDRFPITESLTLADVYAVIPFNNEMVVGRIKGEHLAAVAEHLKGGLVAQGLARNADGAVLVNGRPIDKKRTYQVATNGYVASGGDGFIDPEHFIGGEVYAPTAAESPPTIAELMIGWLDRDSVGRARGAAGTLSPTEDFPDLHRRPLWSFIGSVNAAYNQLTVVNPERDGQPAYDQSQLTVKSADQINLEASAVVEADTRDHGWESDLFVHYAQASIADDEGATLFEETKDLIRLKSLYQFTGFRAGRWYVPSPYVEAQGESEFDRPESRDWHKLLLTGIVGARFELLPPLAVKVGFNTRRELNRPDTETEIGLTTGYSLERTDLVGILGQPLEFDSDLEYFYNSINDDNIHELRSTSRLYYAFFGEFYFTTTFRLFALRTEPVGAWGTNTELTFGLNYRFDTRFQSF